MCKPSIGGVVKSDLDLEEQYLNLNLDYTSIFTTLEGFGNKDLGLTWNMVHGQGFNMVHILNLVMEVIQLKSRNMREVNMS